MSTSEAVGELALANANAPTRFQLAPEAIDAWRLQLEPLQNGYETDFHRPGCFSQALPFGELRNENKNQK